MVGFVIQFRVPGLYSFRVSHVDEFAEKMAKKTSDRTTHHLSTEPALLRAPYCLGTYSGRFCLFGSVLPGLLGGGFKHFLFPPLPGEMIQID